MMPLTVTLRKKQVPFLPARVLFLLVALLLGLRRLLKGRVVALVATGDGRMSKIKR